MSKYNTVMSALGSEISRYDFNKIVDLYDGDNRVRTLTTRNYFNTMLYGQITNAFSMSEIVKTLSANTPKLYHSGLSAVKKSTFSDAGKNRNSRIFEDIFYHLLKKANNYTANSKMKFKNPLRIIDASTIDLNLNKFKWAHFRKAKGAIKLHASYNPDTALPYEMFITSGKVHEVNTLLNFKRDPGDVLVVDRGYNDYKLLYKMHLDGVFFVIRKKKNAVIKLRTVFKTAKSDSIKSDSIITLESKNGKKDYPVPLRMIEYYDKETEKLYHFITNDFNIEAKDIADIYKERWQVELFFKWIKQNLKIKTFWGTSKNAVWTQIWIALILHVLLWIMKVKNNLNITLQKMLQVLKTTLFDKRCLKEIFEPPPTKKVKLKKNKTLFGEMYA